MPPVPDAIDWIWRGPRTRTRGLLPKVSSSLKQLIERHQGQQMPLSRPSQLEVAGAFVRAARDCALSLLEGAYIMRQGLDLLDLPKPVQARFEAVCDDLVAAKHDAISDIFMLDELIGCEIEWGDLTNNVSVILREMAQPLGELKSLIDGLGTGADGDATGRTYFMAVAASMMDAFNVAAAAAATHQTGEADISSDQADVRIVGA